MKSSTQQSHSKAYVSPINSTHESSIGRILLDMGKITLEEAEQILRHQKEKGLRFGEAAQSLGLITDADIQQVLARQFDYPYLHPEQTSFSRKLVAAYEPFSEQVEKLRAIRSQLMLRWFARGRKSLVIASVNSSDGTSYFAANLAVVFSQLGEQTLLVDANLRNPCQHEIFSTGGNTGLSDVLAGRASFEVARKVESFVSLSVLQAGTSPPNPQELLSRDSFTDFTQKAAGQFDVVLYDVPNFSGGADAYAVASRIGAVLLVIRKNRTNIAELRGVAEQLNQLGVELVGSIIVEH